MDERARLLTLFDEAVNADAARYKTATLIGLSERTLKRWRQANGAVVEDQRPLVTSAVQPHTLTTAEEAAILAVCNQVEYRSLPPSQSKRP